MMQASLEAAELDRKVWNTLQRSGLSPILRNWHEAAASIQAAFLRAGDGLVQSGTPKPLVERIGNRFDDLRERSTRFDPFTDLRPCVEHWKSLGVEFTLLSGPSRDGLLALLARWQPRIDLATEQLSGTLGTEGLTLDHYRILVRLREERDKARQRYELLRQQYLQAESDWAA